MLARLEQHHRAKLVSLLADTPEFTPADVAVALELVDIGLADEGYRFLLFEEGDELLGYACFGATPMTEACFDLYWLVVARAARGRGIGRLLLTSVEHAVAIGGGQLIRVETAGLAAYQPARSLYARAGYAEVGHIRDFYARGNDLFIFSKYLDQGAPRTGVPG